MQANKLVHYTVEVVLHHKKCAVNELRGLTHPLIFSPRNTHKIKLLFFHQKYAKIAGGQALDPHGGGGGRGKREVQKEEVRWEGRLWDRRGGGESRERISRREGWKVEGKGKGRGRKCSPSSRPSLRLWNTQMTDDIKSMTGTITRCREMIKDGKQQSWVEK